jgi:hypothetical protein
MNNIYFVLICPCLPYVFMYIYMRAVCMYVYKFPHMDVCMHARTPADCLYKHSADNTRSPTQDRAVIVFEALGHFKECSLYVCDKQPFTPNSVCSQAPPAVSARKHLSLSLSQASERLFTATQYLLDRPILLRGLSREKRWSAQEQKQPRQKLSLCA